MKMDTFYVSLDVDALFSYLNTHLPFLLKEKAKLIGLRKSLHRLTRKVVSYVTNIL